MAFQLRLARALALASTLALSALAAHAQRGAAINIDNFDFSPMTVTVPAGSAVTWTNNDDIPHAIRAVDGSFHSRALDTGDSYSFTFAKPGTYAYFCSIHPKMVGKIIVR